MTTTASDGRALRDVFDFEGASPIQMVERYADLLKGCRFIGLHARKRGGKDTFYRGLHMACLGYANAPRFHHTSFANPLKGAAQAIFGGKREWYYGSEDERNVVDPFWAETLGPAWSTGRKILQHMGTELFRVHFPDIWLLASLHNIISMLENHGAFSGDCFVFADVRFDNEAEFIHALMQAGGSGDLIHIVNANLTDPVEDHASEQPIAQHFITRSFIFKSADQNIEGGAEYGLREILGIQGEALEQAKANAAAARARHGQVVEGKVGV